MYVGAGMMKCMKLAEGKICFDKKGTVLTFDFLEKHLSKVPPNTYFRLSF
jgi:hypothetical protein